MTRLRSRDRDQVHDLFTVLGDPTRRALIQHLRRRPLRAGELADLLGKPPAAISRHLKVLCAAGVASADRIADDARVRVFRLRREPFVALRAWLDQVEAFWSDQLNAFAAHARRQRK